MDWENFKNTLASAIWGETRSWFKKGMVLTGVVGLIYYLSPTSPEAPEIGESESVKKESSQIRGDWESFERNEKTKSKRAPAAAKSTRDLTKARAKKRNNSQTSVEETSNGSSRNRVENFERDPNVGNSGSSRNWVSMGSYSPSSSSSAYESAQASDQRSRDIGSESPTGSDAGDYGEQDPICCAAGSTVGNPDTGEGIVDSDEDDTSSNVVTCSLDRPQGLYGASLSVGITCSSPAKIYYCVQLGGGHCDPSTGVLYSGPIDLNLGDNIYDISYYAESISSNYITEVASATYTIDSTLPDLVVDFPLIQTQTSELPFLNTSSSSDFGKPYLYYSQVNLKSYNPGSVSCRDIFDGYHLYSPTPVAIQSSLDVEPFDAMMDQIEQSIDLARLAGGDNYIVTFIEDQQRDLVTCQTQKVVVKDFHVASFTGAGASTGARSIAGGFVSYGHFQNDPLTPTSSGKSESVRNDTKKLVTSLWDLFF